ncbi:MAG: FapA family protein [Planctomycetota bacterium]
MSEQNKPPVQPQPPSGSPGAKPPSTRTTKVDAAPAASAAGPTAKPPTTKVSSSEAKPPTSPDGKPATAGIKAPPVPVVVDDGIRVEVIADGMVAVAKVPAGASCPASSLLERMLKSGVIAGVIEPALHEVETPAKEEREIVVAKGTPVQKPQDARIDIKVSFALKLTEDSHHNVDFKEQGLFHEVNAAQVLAELIPKQIGKAGTTVLGKELSVSEPKDVDIASVSGKGTKVVATGNGQVVAEFDGLVVRSRSGQLEIQPTVEITGDLDMHTGNLTTRLPVNIRGDIIAGFSLKSDANVTVGGVIEDARISVKGSLTCAGILHGDHRVKTHGDLKTKHVTGREIKCRHLEVASDLRGAKVFAIGNVTAKQVVSSNVQCGGSMVCDLLGHAAELGGVIQVGMNPMAVALCRLAEREQDVIKSELRELRQQTKRQAALLKGATQADKRQRHAQELQLTLAKYERAAKGLAECERVLTNKTLRMGNNPEATLTVNERIFPGVEVRIGADAVMVITKPLGKTIFRLKDGKVAWDMAIGETKLESGPS